MKFISTRGQAPTLGFSQAMLQGLASDGGLYVPEKLPQFRLEDFDGIESLPQIAEKLLRPFLQGDPLESQLSEICQSAFNFPIPLKYLKNHTAVLELFHGPTCAFKDVGARFLAECLSRTKNPSEMLTILVATSGDTGGAVAGAFYEKPGIEVMILFPKGKISSRQEKQLTAWGKNIHAFSVRGDFDDCQRMVKEAFQSPEWKRKKKLTSANSISVGRILPQMVYYAASSLWYFRKTGKKPGFIIPSGNIGNSMGALWTQAMGLPIRNIVLSLNANRSVSDFLASGEWKPQATIATLANAMDVGNPSNMERLRFLFPNIETLQAKLRAFSVNDSQIKATIQQGPERWGEVWCPHTATAVFVREKLSDEPDWILVATAHPAKFETIVEPLIGTPLSVPPSLEKLLKQPSHATEIDNTLASL